MAGTGKFCTLPKKDFFFIQPGKMFRALLGYFVTMLGKGISSQRQGPGNLAEDSGLGNSNKSGPHPPPPTPKHKPERNSENISRHIGWSCCGVNVWWPAMKIKAWDCHYACIGKGEQWGHEGGEKVKGHLHHGLNQIRLERQRSSWLWISRKRTIATIWPLKLTNYYMCSKFVPSLFWKLYLKTFIHFL